MAHPSLSSHPKVREAIAARDALAAALTRAGIQLPAMDVRTPWLTDLMDDDADEPGHGGGTRRTPRYGLIHLGICSAPVAHALAEVIDRGAAR